MKRKVIILALFALVFSLVFSSCDLLSGDKSVTKLTIVDGTFSYEYNVGDTPDLSKIKVQADYNDGSSKVLGYSDLTISAIDTATAGTKSVTITYDGKSITVEVKVEAKQNETPEEPEVTLTGIAIDASSISTRVIKGAAFDATAIKVIATYSDNTTKNLTAADLATIGTVDTATAGDKTLTVTYAEKSANITVKVVEVTTIQIVGTTGITVMQGDTISTAGITAFATYSDGVIETVANDALTFDVPATTEAGAKVITVSYRGATATIPVTVKAPATVIGIEVDYNSIKNYTVVADGVALDMAAIKENIVVYAIWGYTDGTTSQVERKEAITDKSLITITETNDTERYITVTYATYSAKISISETAPVVTAIVLDKYSTGVKLDKIYDQSKIEITVTYSNGTTETLTYGASGLTASAIDTATAGEKTLTVTYEGKTATATVTVYGITSIAPIGSAPTGIVGEALSFGGMTFLVTYADNETEEIAAGAVTITGIDTATAGDKSATVTYKGVSGNVPYSVKGVKSVTIESGTITTRYNVGDTFNYDNVRITVIYTDGTTDIFDKASAASAGFTFGSIDTSAVGTYDFTVSYKGVTSAAIKVAVDAIPYEILGVSEPDAITLLPTKKEYFINGTYGYVVGDDNPFKYSLTISAYDANDKKVTITKYTSKSLVYILEGGAEKLLQGDELATYVTIDEANNSFDFTDAAVGKSFKIATRPAYGLAPEEYADFTRTLAFNVVDAYNVYTAKELHVMSNYDENKAEAETLLANMGINIDTNTVNGVVLHNDIRVTAADMLPMCLVEVGSDSYGKPVYNTADWYSLYGRDLATGDFSIYGNYFTIFTYDVPMVQDNAEKTLNSHVQLFRVRNSAVAPGFNHRDYKFYASNLQIQDNDPNVVVDPDSVRSRLGLIGFKIGYVDATLDNVVIERYYISYLVEEDNTQALLTECKFYNAWQNHIFVADRNLINGENDTVDQIHSSHERLKLFIEKSQITTCGGPVIISQTANLDEARGEKSASDIVIDAETKIWTYTMPNSTWFNVMGATPYATKIMSLNQLLAFATGSSYVVTNPLDGVYNGDFINIIGVILPAGEDVTEIIKGGLDMDGTITVGSSFTRDDNGIFTVTGGQTVANMDDDAMLMENIVKEIIVGGLMQQGLPQQAAVAMLKDIPILRSSNGGWAYIGGSEAAPEFIDLGTTIEMVLATKGMTVDIPEFEPGEGGYLTFYYMGMAILLGNYQPIEQ